MPDPTPPTPGSPPAGSDAGTGAPTDWRSALPEDIRGEKSLSTFKDIGGLAKSYVESQKLIGGSVRIPGSDAKPEEVSAFHRKLGVPEAPDKYELKTGPWIDEPALQGFRQAAHKLGVPPAAAQGLLDWYGSVWEARQGNIGEETKRVESQLKQEWGAAYEKHIALAQRTVREMGGEELLTFLDDSGLGNNPALIKMLARVGSILAEDGAIPGEVDGIISPEAARQKIAQIMADANHPYHQKFAGKPGHEDAVAEVTKLFQLAYPDVA